MGSIGVATEKSVLANGEKLDKVLEALDIPDGKIYGFRIDKTDSNPATRVTYLKDAVGMTPASMNFSTGTFNYGDWEDVWFVKNNYPVMLKYDGTEDYKLNPKDYSKKLDGTASDVANTSYGGNAMSAIPLVWLWQYESGNYQYVYVASYKVDDNYKAYAHTNQKGAVLPVIYMSIFGGYLDGNNKLRSISGQTLMQSKTAEQEITYAKANGGGWFTKTWAQRNLMQCLFVLMFKTTQSQGALGRGNLSGSGAQYLLQTGTLNDKWQFFGYSDNTHQVKFMHQEKPWSDQWDRIAGMVNDNGTVKVKMTAPYPTSSLTASATFSDYIPVGKTPSGTNGGYINETQMSEYGDIPCTASGSETTYECDGLWFNNGQVDFALVGGYCYNASLCGVFCLSLNHAASNANWHIGASLSYTKGN